MNKQPINYLTLALILLLVMMFLSSILPSCYSQKKAHRQGAKWITTYRQDAAITTRDEFPCVEEKPDTVRIIDSSQYKEAIKILQGTQDVYNRLNDSLASIIEQHENDHPALSDTCKDYKASIIALKKQNADLIYQIKHIPPVIDSIPKPYKVLDSAAMYVLESKNASLTNSLTIVQASDAKHSRQAKTRGLILLGLLLALGVWTYFKVRSTFKPKL